MDTEYQIGTNVYFRTETLMFVRIPYTYHSVLIA